MEKMISGLIHDENNHYIAYIHHILTHELHQHLQQ